MPEPLFLDSLEIRNFRVFDRLCIERVGRVNLIVGKNNVGKSSVLEALFLYANQGNPSAFWQLLENRDEGRRPAPSDSTNERYEADGFSIARQIFHEGKVDKKGRLEIFVGSCASSNNNLLFVLELNVSVQENNGITIIGGSGPRPEDFIPVFQVKVAGQESLYRVNRPVGTLRADKTSCIFIPATGLSPAEIGWLWDSISLTSSEADVLAGLQIISAKVERLNLVDGSRFGLWDRERVPIAKIVGQAEPKPLRSLGEGMNRLFGLALALVKAEHSILLIDEIESGLHYSVQPDVWRLVFGVARRLNIQVFATTHSWDCIIAFQEAAKEAEQDEGVLIRLVEKNGKIVATLFDEDELNIVAREGIEVR